MLQANVKGTSKKPALASSPLRDDPLGTALLPGHTSLLLSQILRSSIFSSSRLVWPGRWTMCHPFGVLRGPLKALQYRAHPFTRSSRYFRGPCGWGSLIVHRCSMFVHRCSWFGVRWSFIAVRSLLFVDRSSLFVVRAVLRLRMAPTDPVGTTFDQRSSNNEHRTTLSTPTIEHRTTITALPPTNEFRSHDGQEQDRALR